MVYPKHKSHGLNVSRMPASDSNPIKTHEKMNEKAIAFDAAADQFDEKKLLLLKDITGLPLPVTHKQYKKNRPIIECLIMLVLVVFTLFYYRII